MKAEIPSQLQADTNWAEKRVLICYPYEFSRMAEILEIEKRLRDIFPDIAITVSGRVLEIDNVPAELDRVVMQTEAQELMQSSPSMVRT